MCRVRNAHTGAPWTTAFICITLDQSCTDANGKYVEKPLTVRMVQWQPFCVKATFDPKTPVCAACKKTNRTRSFCRERHKHRQLPWCTVYVLLSALDSAEAHTVVAGPSQLVPGGGEYNPADGESTPTKSGDGDNSEGGARDDHADAKYESTGTPVPASASFDSAQTTVPTSDESDKKKKGKGEEGDDINDISDSRTFLAKVSGKSSTIHWLELADYEAGDAAGYPPTFVSTDGSAVPQLNPGMAGTADPNHAQYYAYAAQQHQQALQSQQQYYFRMHQRGQNPYPPPPPPPFSPPLSAVAGVASLCDAFQGHACRKRPWSHTATYHKRCAGPPPQRT